MQCLSFGWPRFATLWVQCSDSVELRCRPVHCLRFQKVAAVIIVGVIVLVARFFFLLLEADRQASAACSVGHNVGCGLPHCFCSAAIWLSHSVGRHNVEG